MNTTIVLLLSFIVAAEKPSDPPKEPKTIIDIFDVVEVNHCHNSTTGKERLTQTIWYKWKKTWVPVSSANGTRVFDSDTFPLIKKPPSEVPLFDEYSLRRRWDYGYEITGWKMIKNDNLLPILEDGVYVQRWKDGKINRKVVCLFRIETWTTFDPEIFDRSFVSEDNRIGLSKP